MEWISSLSLDDHESQEISKEKLSDEFYHSLPDWFAEIRMTDTEDKKSVESMKIDQNFSLEAIEIPAKICQKINEKPCPEIDRLIRKPTVFKRRAKDEWPPIIDDWLNNDEYNIRQPFRQSSPKPSSNSTNSSPRVARHRKTLSSKRLNFDI